MGIQNETTPRTFFKGLIKVFFAFAKISLDFFPCIDIFLSKVALQIGLGGFHN